ncbi:hypothetical protein JB92DRAFT_3131917 [Gautieria morchelliformis]|nr:hypothetical protein JB92DRAFT_3131917 [Gautieria morchelliformis]
MEIKLCFVAEISTSDFWMDADGGYTGKAFVDGTIPSFAKTKGSLVIVEPRMEPWKDDFRRVVKAFQRNSVKIVHTFFTEIYEEWKNDVETHYAPDPDFSIENWPVGVAASEQLATMVEKGTHIVNPLPAVDMNGHLIKPWDYHPSSLEFASPSNHSSSTSTLSAVRPILRTAIRCSHISPAGTPSNTIDTIYPA